MTKNEILRRHYSSTMYFFVFTAKAFYSISKVKRNYLFANDFRLKPNCFWFYSGKWLKVRGCQFQHLECHYLYFS